jgi:hypothetical protein
MLQRMIVEAVDVLLVTLEFVQANQLSTVGYLRALNHTCRDHITANVVVWMHLARIISCPICFDDNKCCRSAFLMMGDIEYWVLVTRAAAALNSVRRQWAVILSSRIMLDTALVKDRISRSPSLPSAVHVWPPADHFNESIAATTSSSVHSPRQSRLRAIRRFAGRLFRMMLCVPSLPQSRGSLRLSPSSEFTPHHPTPSEHISAADTLPLPRESLEVLL